VTILDIPCIVRTEAEAFAEPVSLNGDIEVVGNGDPCE